jgi:hypothetical protein
LRRYEALCDISHYQKGGGFALELSHLSLSPPLILGYFGLFPYRQGDVGTRPGCRGMGCINWLNLLQRPSRFADQTRADKNLFRRRKPL